MEKIGTKIIEVNSWQKEEFDVYPCNCKIGDTIWFDEGIPDEDGTITNHSYLYGKVIDIDPEHWWIYDDGENELGYVTIKIDDDSEFYAGLKFAVAFKDIIYEEPEELVLENAMKLLKSCEAFSKEMDVMNKDIAFLINEYKTNKKYFRQEPGRCTVNDVIKTVYEFAWASSKNYHINE